MSKVGLGISLTAVDGRLLLSCTSAQCDFPKFSGRLSLARSMDQTPRDALVAALIGSLMAMDAADCRHWGVGE